jgi:ribokinase
VNRVTDNPRILVVGSINMDIVCNMEKVPVEGETVIGADYAFIPGGKGANQAVACARLGVETFFAGKLGKDAFGDELTAALRRDGIDTRLLQVEAAEASGMASIWVSGNGHNRIAIYPGANKLLSPVDIEDAFAQGDYDACLVQFEIPEETVIECARQAIRRNIKLIVDTGPARAFPLEKLGGVYMVSPNETETQALCGMLPVDEASAFEAARLIKARCGCETVVIKMGEKGAYVYADEFTGLVPGFQVTAADTTAAGDAFTAALTCRLAMGDGLAEAVLYANAVGALTVTKRGAQTSLPTLQETELFLNAQK